MTQSNLSTHRVQINLPPDLYQLVRGWAYEQNVSISEVIRKKIVTTKIKAKTNERKPDTQKQWQEVINKYVGSIKGHSDDSATHSHWAGQTAVFHEQ